MKLKIITAPVFGSKTIPWYLAGGVSLASCLMAYKSKGAATQAQSYTNLANPGVYDLSPGNAPAWNTAIGWTFTPGSSHHLDIGGGSGPTLNGACSLIARINPEDDGTTRNLIAGAAAGFVAVQMKTTNKPALRVAGTEILVADTAILTEKVTCFTYSAAGEAIAYLNGVADGTATNDQAVTTDTDLLGCSAHVNYYSGTLVALAVYNAVLTPAQVLAITNAMLAL